MAVTLTVNGTGYSFPQTSDESWGDNVTNWATAVTNGMLQKAGGTFTLTAEVDFGANYGLKSLYFKSRATNPASAGQVRLGNAESVSWRNAANSADLALKANASNKLEFNSIEVVDVSTAQTLTNKTLSGSNNTFSNIGYASLSLTGSIVNADISNSAAIAYSKLNLGGSIVNADISASAAIAYSKLNLASSIVNADISNSAAIGYSKLNLSGSILNADINASAAIALSKLASVTASRALVSDGSGFISASSVTATELGLLSGRSGTLVTTGETQTLTSKTLISPTLTTPVVDDGLDLNEEASLSSPSSGKRRLGLKTDGKLYLRDSSGNESVVGSGSGTGINYVSNPDAETDTSGYSTYADAAGTSPVDGTGGVPNVTWTRSTSSPLRGIGSFLLTKDAANRQGEGASYAFTIADADKAKVLSVSFEYEIASGTYADNDLSVWIYDVTNGTLIQPAGHQIKNVGIESKHSATFQTASNSTSYRLIFHVSSASTSAYAVKFDDITVSPSVVVQGTPVTDWQSWTPTGTWTGGTATYSGFWRRVGDSAEIYFRVNVNSGVTAASLSINMPAGLTIDIAKMGDNNTRNTYGTWTGLDDSTAAKPFGYVLGGGASSVSIYYVATQNNATDPLYAVSNTAPITWAASDTIAGYFRVPILGWSSNVVMSDSADTRVVSAAYYGTASTVTNAGDTVIAYSTLKHDTHGCYNTSTGRYTVKVPGKYRVAAAFETTPITAGTVDSPVIIYIWKNGTAVYMQQWPALATGSTFRTANILGTVDCVAGDYIEIAGNQQLSAGAKSLSNSIRTWLAIDMVSGPAQIAASETVACRYTTAAGQSIPNSTATTVVFGTKGWDSHGAFNAATGVFTAPISGTYSVKAAATLAGGGGWAAGEEASLQLYKNTSTQYSYLDNEVLRSASTDHIPLYGSDEIKLLAGETMEIKLQQNSGGAINLSASALLNHIAITRVGNY